MFFTPIVTVMGVFKGGFKRGEGGALISGAYAQVFAAHFARFIYISNRICRINVYRCVSVSIFGFLLGLCSCETRSQRRFIDNFNTILYISPPTHTQRHEHSTAHSGAVVGTVGQINTV